MLDFVKHQLINNKEFLLQNSFKNCAIEGLHLILLSSSNEVKIRLYITSKDHLLYKNQVFPDFKRESKCLSPSELMSQPVHHNKYDSTIKVINGDLINTIYTKCSQEFERSFALKEYKCIIGTNPEETYFKYTQNVNFFYINKYKSYSANSQSSFFMMKNFEYHNLSVSKNSVAAWLVFESGSYETDYLMYSNNMPSISSSNYQKFSSIEEITDLLETAYNCKLKYLLKY